MLGAIPLAGRWPLRVLIDGYFIDRAYGFGRYVRELVYALDRAGVVDLVVAVPTRGVPIARSLVTRGRVVAAANRFFPLWEQVTIPWIARRQQCDLVHFPYQSMALAWPCARSVVTMHDLMFFRSDRTAAQLIDRLANAYRRVLFRLSTRRAARIVAVSAATGEELAPHLAAAAIVVPNTCDAFVAAHPAVAGATAGPRYFLHRGAPGPHKNTRGIVQAFQALRARRADVELRIFGVAAGDPFAAEIAGPGVRFLGRITDAELAALYRAAAGVVVASLEEGFGLAIIEAFAFRAPVITSDRAPMSEIALDAALLVDPLDPTAIARAMGNLLDDAALVARLRVAGERRRNDFSSAQVARRLESVYRSVAA